MRKADSRMASEQYLGDESARLRFLREAQVVAGLAAVHEQNLVHRDIKQSNIMVRLKDDGSLRAKIIDLGLAKSLNEPGDQTAISTPGAFAGTRRQIDFFSA